MHGSTASGRAAQVILAAGGVSTSRARRSRSEKAARTGKSETAALAEIDAAPGARGAGEDGRGDRPPEVGDRVSSTAAPKDALLLPAQITSRAGRRRRESDLSAAHQRLSELSPTAPTPARRFRCRNRPPRGRRRRGRPRRHLPGSLCDQRRPDPPRLAHAAPATGGAAASHLRHRPGAQRGTRRRGSGPLSSGPGLPGLRGHRRR